jgi:phage baseplate assembly protein W
VSNESGTGREFLGVGWGFPLRVNAQGGLSYVDGAEDVQQAIWIIVGTAAGERVMLPSFGCGIHEYVFSPNSETTAGNLAHHVRKALVDWEPRIDVGDVTVEGGREENVLLIRVDYRIRATNAFHNLVYPFYIKEGAGV